MNDKDLNIALGKLFNGIELKAEKVELGLVDDLEADFKELNKLMSEAKKQVKETSRIVGKSRTLSKNIVKNGKDAIKKLEDLGMGAEAGFIKTMVAYSNNAQKALSDYKSGGLFDF